MQSHETLLRHLGDLIRTRRVAAGLTQDALGARAGIVGKYVSEIERGTRDVPLSTLLAVVEDGLGMRLDVRFQPRSTQKEVPLRAPLPRPVEEVARLIALLPGDRRGRVLAVLRGILAIAKDR